MAAKTRIQPADALRPHRAEAPFLDHVSGSVLYCAGRTKVLCTALFEEGVPPFLLGKDQGWITAEYDLLPGSTAPRHARERGGKLSGRTMEIQRIIGRAIRAAVDLSAFPGWTLKLDCDVLQADGGTRSAGVNGAWIATALALEDFCRQHPAARKALRTQVAAVSVGLHEGGLLLDMDYGEDSKAAVDLTIAMNSGGGIIEIQGTAEHGAMSQDELAAMISLGRKGIEEIFAIQRGAAGAASLTA